MSLIPSIRRTLQSYNYAGEISERTLRSGLAVSRLSKKSIHVSASISNTWNIVYLSRTMWDLGEIATLSAFIELNQDGTLQQKDGHYVWRGWLKSTARIALFAARILCLTTSLHDAQAFRLKENHLANIYISVASIWTLATAGAFFASAYESSTTSATKQSYMELIRRTFDFSSIMFDLLKTTSSSCGIISAVLNLAAGTTTLFYELAWHRKI